MFPSAEHRMCARHIYANWRKKHRLQEYQKRFWKIAKASSEMLFKHYKNKLANKTPRGWINLQKTDPIHWCRAWFKVGSNCESVDNNMSESFNSWIIEARFKPILTMLEDIRILVTRRIQENRSNCERWSMELCPNIIRKVTKIRHRTQYCHVLWNGEIGFEVRDKKWRFTVDIKNKICSCGYWQVSGIPCAHACAALFKMTEEPNNYVHECFSLEAYRRTYQHVLQPVEHELAWPMSDNPKPLPPRVKKMPGRPKKNRRKDSSEPVKSSTKSSRVGIKMTCRRCKGDDHNSRTCSVTMEASGSHNPSQQQATNGTSQAGTTPLAIAHTNSKQSLGKRPAPSSSHTSSSYLQSGHKKQMVSYAKSKSTAQASAKASAGGSASIIIETSAGTTVGSSAKATINVSGGTGSANIQSTSTGRGGHSSSSRKRLGKHIVLSEKSSI